MNSKASDFWYLIYMLKLVSKKSTQNTSSISCCIIISNAKRSHIKAAFFTVQIHVSYFSVLFETLQTRK